MLTAVLLGLVLGLRHAADPDHVIAVSAIAARHGGTRRAAAVGLAWGLGHSLAVVGVGSLLVLLQLAVPARVAAGMEGTVGLVLIALGFANLRWAAARSSAPRAASARGGWRSFGVGVVHGLAGTAALALLAAAAMPNAGAAVVYLAVFALGSTLGMVGVSLGLGAPLAWLLARPGGGRAVAAATGVLALAFGGWLVVEAGLVQGGS